MQHISIGLHFSDWDHRKITEVTFSPIAVKFDVEFIGEVITTISLTGAASGTFDPTAQSITLTLGLFFKHSTSLADPSTLALTLYTTAALTEAGTITVAGSEAFQGGYLHGESGWLTVTGSIMPHP
jgi:hypothetical protein